MNRLTTTAADSVDALRQDAAARWAACGFTTQLVTVQDVAVHVAAGGQGPPVVLLHGYPQSGEIWRGIAPALASSHKVIIPDLRGMGLSDPGTEPHLLTTAAGDVIAVLAALGIAQAAVVGHDWGGAVGATLALSHRQAVSCLVFIESALAGAGFEQLWRFDQPNPALTFIPFLLMGGVAEALVAGREDIFLQHLWQTFTADKAAAPFEAWAPYIAALRRSGQFTAGADYYRCAYASAAASQRLLMGGKLSVPVLPIAGARGQRACNEAMAKNFAADVRAGIVLQGAGHFVPEERPREVLAALQGFLNSL